MDTDLDFGVREDLLSEARTLCQTYALCRRVIRQYSQYVIGTCNLKWDTGDQEWDDAAERQWQEWMPQADLLGVHSFPMIMRLGQMAELRDGDIFFRKVQRNGFLKIQYIEADRIKNGHAVNFDIEDKIVGGVGLGPLLEPIYYRVYDRTKFGLFKNQRDYPKSEICHWFDPDRLDAYRGVTAFSAVLNDIRDNKEIKDAEKASHKLRSKIALIVRNALGRKHTHGVDVLSGGNNGTQQVAYEDVGEAAIKYQYSGDEFTAFNSNMPADSWFKFSQHLVRNIAIGTDLPFEFVWDMAGLTGPAVRMTSAQAARTFRHKQDLAEEKAINPIGSAWVTLEMEEGRLPFNPNWMRFRTARPRHVTIDSGRDSAADLSELAAGATSLQRMAEARGVGDAREILKQKAQELQWAKELAEEYDVEETAIIASAAGTGENSQLEEDTVATEELERERRTSTREPDEQRG
jgi:capsid protein